MEEDPEACMKAVVRLSTHSWMETWLASKRPWQLLSLLLTAVVVALVVHAPVPNAVVRSAFPNTASPEPADHVVQPAPHAFRGLAAASSTSSCSETQGSHPQDALFFLVNAIFVGTVILNLTMMPMLRGLQQTVVLFVLGMTYSVLQHGLGLTEHLGLMGRSYAMWMDIDPHLLSFAMLPVLLAGDAMTIDTSVARAVAKQCIYLAGPGVMVSAFLTALFLWVYLPYDWPFLLCLVTGSILAATDPVAVVGLLKELGASPTLTVQIQGESLLNDGTAIVLFSVAYSMLGGEEYDPGEVIIYLVKTALCAAGLGVVIGYVFFLWIRRSASRLEHSSSMTQSALTLLCAYWSFILSEGLLHISGVLCTVGASLVLADKMWPVIVDKESLHHVWHMFEYLGNTIIFFLAGALTGKSMTQIPWEDYLHLIVIYFIATVIRGSLLFASRPLLQHLGESTARVSAADAAIMTWGGLRGAVGLVLAMQVSRDRAGNRITGIDGDRVLFYVGGIATLTLVINASTCPALVRLLGITSTPAARQRLLMNIYEQLSRLARNDKRPYAVKETLQTVLHDAKHHIESLVQDKDKNPAWANVVSKVSSKLVIEPNPVKVVDLLNMFEAAKADFDHEVDDQVLKLLDMPDVHWSCEKCDTVKEFCQKNDPDGEMVQVIHEAFLSLVRAEYWDQIEAGDFTAGTTDAEILLSSVSFAFKHTSRRLADFTFLRCYLQFVHEEVTVDERHLSQEVARLENANVTGIGKRRAHRRSPRPGTSDLENVVPAPVPPSALATVKEVLRDIAGTQTTRLQSLFEESACINLGIAVVILLNAAFIGIEQAYRDSSNRDHAAWFVVEILFNAIFTAEFLIKVMAFRLAYFCSGWNLFDFVLVVIGLFGLGIEAATLTSDGSEEDVSGEARLLRVNRVFRVLRIIRVFRLAKFIKLLKAKFTKKDLCLELAEHLQTITVLRAFVQAHTKSQAALLDYIGTEGNIRSCEEARCILASQTEIYQAIILAVAQAQKVSGSRLSGMAMLRSNISATAELTGFVLSANKSGMINSREAECILHPLEEHMRAFYKRLQDSYEGLQESRLEESTPRPGPGETFSEHCSTENHGLQPQLRSSQEVWNLPGCTVVSHSDDRRVMDGA